MKLRSIFVLTVISIGSQAHAEFVENTDITSYVNSLIEENKTVTIPNGNFLVSATKSIQLKDNSTLKLSPNTVLNVIPTSSGSYRVFKIKNVKNVSISGGKLIGDKYTHLGKAGEWGMGVEIRDSQNVSLSNMSIDKMWG
ncbi:TPA: right-handed parallel beta-helix repeat-containing protein, partial [Acinetobacter baumannii]